MPRHSFGFKRGSIQLTSSEKQTMNSIAENPSKHISGSTFWDSNLLLHMHKLACQLPKELSKMQLSQMWGH
jgi:hypothetical protein